MLATIILDTFSKAEAAAIADALDDLCSPSDCYAFSCTAVYVFWSVPERQIIYIGLASDVGQRFRQHVGLVSCDAGSCKHVEISKYFMSRERLGYAIIVQSKMSQVLSAEEQDIVSAALSDGVDPKVWRDYFGARDNVVVAEGGLIELFKGISSCLPSWNKICGSRRGAERVKDDLSSNCTLLANLTGDQWSELNAKATLRELSDNTTFCEHELVLHGGRMQVVSTGTSLEAAMRGLAERGDDGGRYDQMISDGYLARAVRLPGID